jgi:hypothetical protein
MQTYPLWLGYYFSPHPSPLSPCSLLPPLCYFREWIKTGETSVRKDPLTLMNIQAGDAGEYTCIAKNLVGIQQTARDSFNLKVTQSGESYSEYSLVTNGIKPAGCSVLSPRCSFFSVYT